MRKENSDTRDTTRFRNFRNSDPPIIIKSLNIPETLALNPPLPRSLGWPAVTETNTSILSLSTCFALYFVLSSMAVSDTVVGNLTTIYVAVIAGIKAYGLVFGRSFGGAFVLIASTTVVGLILIATLTWDVSRKATYAFTRDHIHGHSHEMCKGGICWHGVAVRSPASQVRFRLPQQIPYGAL